MNANIAFDKAIDYCMEKCSGFREPNEVVAGLKDRNAALHSSLRHALAISLGEMLKELYGESVRLVSLYGSSVEYTAGIYSDIDIVLLVSSKEDEIKKTIKEADTIFRELYFLMLSMPADSSDYLFDAHVINENSRAVNAAKTYLNHIIDYESVPLIS